MQCRNLQLAYDERLILEVPTLDVPMQKITTILGANGCGKSTLLKHLAAQALPKTGEVLLDGKNVLAIAPKQLSKQLAMLPQSPTTFSDMSIFDLVKLGRYPHQSFSQQWRAEDELIVRKVLNQTDLYDLKERSLSELSGGQKQRAWIALTLAQQSDIILLDEPINHLDVHHQIEILDLVHQLKQEQKTIILVLHDLNLAARYSDHLIMLADKKVYAQGAPEKIMTSDNINKVFDIDAHIIQDPVHNKPMCIAKSGFGS